jgi:Kef-type K+ transport system membrane component KefB
MEEELVSLALIALLASITPLLARLIPQKLIPETVFLLFAGALCGPHMLGWIHVGDAISLLSDLGLAFLFLLAGYEIDPKNLTNYQGKRGFATWLVTFGIAIVAVWLWPAFSLEGIDGIAVVIALTTTALGTLLPILKERNLMATKIGDAILSYGTWGELGPVVAMALLLSTRTTFQSVIVLLIFAAIAVLMAVFISRLKGWKKVETFLREGAETTQQTVVRVTVLLLVALTALSAVFDLDIVLGAFAAGFILRFIIPEGSKSLETKLDGLAFGFFIPLFFIVSGANIDLTAVGQSPDLLIFFIILLLIIRALPIFIALSSGKHRHDLSRSARITVALYCTTALPIIVAVTTVAQQSGAMSSEVASVLVCAGAITVFVMPALASATVRLSDTHVIDLAKEISAQPSDISSIVRDRAELVRLLAKARALIEQDDPDLASRIKPLVRQLAKDSVEEDRNAQRFIEELQKRYKEARALPPVDEEEMQSAEDAQEDRDETKSGYDEEGYLEVIEKGEDAATRKEKR